MKAYKVNKMGYWCSGCDVVFSETDYQTDRALYIPSDHLISQHAPHDSCGGDECTAMYIRTADIKRKIVWFCGEGCLHHDQGAEPEFKPLWACGECGDYYIDQELAVECCK